MPLTVFPGKHECENEYKHERERMRKTSQEAFARHTIETKKRELNMLSATQRLIQVDETLYLLEAVGCLRQLCAK